MLGSIVNVVSEHALKQQGTDLARDDAVAAFAKEIKEPAIKMVKLYLAQSAFTFAYIYSLSCVGKDLSRVIVCTRALKYPCR